LRHRQQESLTEHFDGGDLGVSGGWIRAEASVNLSAEKELHSLVACDRLENQFEHGHLPKGVRNESGDQRRRNSVREAQRQSFVPAANPIEGYRPNPLLAVRDGSEFGSYVAAKRC
jgi:hypothetical protein